MIYLCSLSSSINCTSSFWYRKLSTSTRFYRPYGYHRFFSIRPLPNKLLPKKLFLKGYLSIQNPGCMASGRQRSFELHQCRLPIDLYWVWLRHSTLRYQVVHNVAFYGLSINYLIDQNNVSRLITCWVIGIYFFQIFNT